jgi:hypothetical protein
MKILYLAGTLMGTYILKVYHVSFTRFAVKEPSTKLHFWNHPNIEMAPYFN